MTTLQALLLSLLCVAPAYAARGQEPAVTPREGTFTTHFQERSPHSALDQLARVGNWDVNQLPDWDLEEIEFQLIVPEQYTDDGSYGLLVFIHPVSEITATDPRSFFYGRVLEEVLAKHKLIWVSFDAAGNPVLPHKRMGLALDAVHNVTRDYEIDPRRVYLSGTSGGGRMTCMTAIYHPEIFTGAIPIIGTLYFRQVPVPDDPELRKLLHEQPGENAVWPQQLVRPDRRRLERMALEQRWVLLAGSEDYNMPQMRTHFELGFARDNFRHAHYLEVPGMGHDYPEPQWFERAIVLLDAPLNDAQLADPDDPDAARNAALAMRRLETAKRLMRSDQARALRLLARIIEAYPNTLAAEQAAEIIEQAQQPPTPE